MYDISLSQCQEEFFLTAAMVVNEPQLTPFQCFVFVCMYVSSSVYKSSRLVIECEYIFFSGKHFLGWRSASTSSRLSYDYNDTLSISGRGNIEQPNVNRVIMAAEQSLQCPNCSEMLTDLTSLAQHVSHCQRSTGVYVCSLCSKVYSTTTGLKHHMEVHEGKTFMCPICDSKFTRKGTVKTHMRAVHASAQCLNCAAILRLGDEFNQHVIHCTK
ncbi:unnamed protein product [Candidula unifasciata]|uniref:C2H2-type domain-containing protein n=1 Tax=Candidula unifasciata TaxID=100452 RepID=A0A8S3ZH26_9EUPU|nr:unnamed protein product [Candidula unifasciata]